MSYDQRKMIQKIAQIHAKNHRQELRKFKLPVLSTDVYNSLLKHMGNLHIHHLFYSAEDKKMIVHLTNKEQRFFDVWPKKVTPSPIAFQKTLSYVDMGNPCQHNSTLPCQLCTRKSGMLTKQCHATCINGQRCRRERIGKAKYCWQHKNTTKV